MSSREKCDKDILEKMMKIKKDSEDFVQIPTEIKSVTLVKTSKSGKAKDKWFLQIDDEGFRSGQSGNTKIDRLATLENLRELLKDDVDWEKLRHMALCVQEANKFSPKQEEKKESKYQLPF